MYLQIKIESENAAFDDYAITETVRILREATNRLEEEHVDQFLLDYNGNRVGTLTYAD